MWRNEIFQALLITAAFVTILLIAFDAVLYPLLKLMP